MMDKGWKSLSKVWKQANVRWHMGAPIKQSPIVVIASVKTESGWQSVAIGLTGNAHKQTLVKAIRANREQVKAFEPAQVKRVVPGTLAWLNLNRVVWSIFVGGLMNEETDRRVTMPAQTYREPAEKQEPAQKQMPDWEKEALDALNFGIAQGAMLLGLSPKQLEALKPAEPARTVVEPVVVVEPEDKMTEAVELAAQFVDGTEIPKFCVFDCKKRPTDNNCAHCPFFRNRPVPDSHFSAVVYPKGVISLRARNNPFWDTEIITEERRARAEKMDTYDDTLIAKFCVEGCTKRARADTCERCKYCTCAAGAEKEFAAQIRKARLLVK